MSTKTKYKKKKTSNGPVKCPYCGRNAELRSSEGIYKSDKYGHQMLWVCSNYPECDAYVRCQPGTKLPLGELANGELRALRREAHKFFDELYKNGKMSREGAYRWLSDLLCKPMQEVHISCLSDYHCKLVIEKTKEILAFREKNVKPIVRKEMKGET
ncbi:MAG: zinc-finger-containing protein [Acutalibacteraceae bacterium]|nr:zinc-finger-containing protein [Acutalibacteraceae bacterium]